MKFQTRILAAASMAAMLIVAAGCSSSNKVPTSPALDVVAPTVNATNPLNNAVGMAVMTASFSEPMNASTISPATFAIKGPGGAAVAGSVAYDAANNIAKFLPASALAPATAFKATITTGVKDLAGNPLAGDIVWNFTTSPVAGALEAPVLGSAGTFAVLAGATVTNTGATVLTADLGVSPGTAVTGFPPGILNGTKNAGNPTSAQAMADLTVAYNDAAGRTLAPVTLAGNLGGLTLPPGLYKSTSSLAISSGDLTLDAQGDPNAVFIFQMASTLVTTSGRAVILAGGAKAANIFWQVGSSATLGTKSTFKGTLMAYASITLTSGATLNGRALARIGAVTLDNNSVVSGPVVSPPPPPPPPPVGAPALGSAAGFVILAGSTVTSTGLTTLTGDLGVSPGTAVTGFPPGILNGTKYAGVPTSAQAIADLTIAYNDAAGRNVAPVIIAGNLGGLTLAPGLYKSTSSLAISSGDLTLDAQGNPNAVFIFQMASTLTTTPGRAVILAGGAKASNIFWQVGSSATLGTTCVFKGTIMADQSITLNTGATLDGRALARIGAVSLDGNAAVLPTP